jgi:molecular chaperone DnaK
MKQVVSKAVGIDLGTTNSAVAVMNPANNEIVIHQDPITKSYTTPSCVWRGPGSTETVVGRRAFSRKGSRPEPISSIKRLMGTRATVGLGGEQLSPQQVSALILAEMKQQIEGDVAAFDGPFSRWIVDRAVVTVPVYFDQSQIDATREAAELAGFEVLGLLHEPTAAAIYHCWRTATRDGTFLVYDLGGGTFDVSILRCTAGEFEVLGASGNNLLGGDDIDADFARHLQAMFQADGWALDLDPEHDEEDRSRFNRLKLLAEGTKKALSRTHDFMLRDSGLLVDKAGDPVTIETLVERTELEAIARPLIERTFLHCDEAIARARERAGTTLADVDEVILAGGSTHMPLVRELVQSELCGEPAADSERRERAKCAEPVYEKVDTVVALGAAVRAARAGGMVVFDEDRTVKISLRGAGSTDSSQLSVGGTAEALTPEVNLDGGRVVLNTGDYEDETNLTTEGSFSFTSVPLRADAETELTFEVYDAAGVLRGAAGQPVAHSTAQHLPTAGSSSLPVVVDAFIAMAAGSFVSGYFSNAGSKAREATARAWQKARRERAAASSEPSRTITFEVRGGDGGQVQQTLAEVLHSLADVGSYDFRHPGAVETVKFRLFQEGRPIQVVNIQVPRSMPKDTPILMHMVLHENHAITIEGAIGETPYQTTVNLPTERGMPIEQEVADLVLKFRDNVTMLPAGKRATAEARFKIAHHAFIQARDRGDVAQATYERDQMKAIAESAVPTEGELRPPKTEFDTLVEDCREMHGYCWSHGDPDGQTFDAGEIARSIEEHRRSGERAYTERDQRSYSEALEKIEGIFRYLQDLSRGRQQTPSALSAANRASVELETIKAAAGKLRFAAQEAERDLVKVEEKVERLRSQVSVNPQHVLEESGKLLALLRQIQAGLDVGTDDTQRFERYAGLPPGFAEAAWIVLGLTGGRLALPFADAYVKALGKTLGEQTAALLTSLTGAQPAGSADAVIVELVDGMSDDALLSLLDLDLSSPDMHGALLRWDSVQESWTPVRRKAPSRRARLLIVTATASAQLSTFSAAFAEAVGKDFGERTAVGLRRLALPGRRAEPKPTAPALQATPQALSIAAIRALEHLDMNDPQINGTTLQWDETAQAWRPVVAGSDPR